MKEHFRLIIQLYEVHFLKNKFIYFIYLWLCWVLTAARGPSPVAASGVHSLPRCSGPSPRWPLLPRSTGSRRAGPAVAARGLQSARRLSSRGARAQPLRSTRDPPGPGPEPMSPEPAGRLPTTAPSGKPYEVHFWLLSIYHISLILKHPQL